MFAGENRRDSTKSKINCFNTELNFLITGPVFDYKLIEALALVAQEGGFDKAANALHITQSAVSQRVKLLEEQLEDDLFEAMAAKGDKGHSRTSS